MKTPKEKIRRKAIKKIKRDDVYGLMTVSYCGIGLEAYIYSLIKHISIH
jgi:hypothetical protein